MERRAFFSTGTSQAELAAAAQHWSWQQSLTSSTGDVKDSSAG